MDNKSYIVTCIEQFETYIDILCKNNFYLSRTRHMFKFNYELIGKSITINYKTYIALLIVPYLLSKDKFISGYVITILGLFYVYIGHIFYHSPYSLVFFFIHTYHHDHDDNASVYQEVIMEFLGITLAILLLTIVSGINHINYIYDPYILLYYFFFYSSVHFINYTFLKCNNYHSKHHTKTDTNYFPDICDIIFNTKYNNTNNTNNTNNMTVEYIENTDHWFFNIIGSATIVYFIKYYVEKSTTHIQKNLKDYFIVIYLSLALYMFIFAGTNFFKVIRSIDCYREDTILKTIVQLKKYYIIPFE